MSLEPAVASTAHHPDRRRRRRPAQHAALSHLRRARSARVPQRRPLGRHLLETRPGRARTRVVVLVLLAAVGTGLLVAVVRAGAAPSLFSGVPGVHPAAAVPTDLAAAEVLRSWDVQRSAAYASGSVPMLRDLYVAGSGAGRSDVRVLRAWTRRGLRVQGMRTQVLGLQVLARERDRLVLRVTDRLVAAAAVGVAGTTPLPRDRADTRVLTLRRGSDGAWRVAAVRPAG